MGSPCVSDLVQTAPMAGARIGFAISELSGIELRRLPTTYSIDALRRVPGVSVDEVKAKTEAEIVVAGDVKTVEIS